MNSLQELCELKHGPKPLWSRLCLGAAGLAVAWAALGLLLVLVEQSFHDPSRSPDSSVASLAQFRDDDDGDWSDDCVPNENSIRPLETAAAEQN